MLSSEQWNKIDKKYGRLMYKISHQISGDTAIAAFEDNLQDIKLAAMEAVVGFTKQNGGSNGDFEKFWGTKGFDQYIKTCMWTKKNNKGAKISKKASILKGTVSTTNEEVLNIEDEYPNLDEGLFLEEFSLRISPDQRKLVNLVIGDPTLIKPGGKFNVKRISEALGMSWFKTNKVIKNLAAIIYNEL